jgi:hypothetical protein
MPPIVAPEKLDVQTFDVQAGAAASEATMQKIGASVNFWNAFFEGTREWNFNGRYDIIPAPQFGVDGMQFAWSDCEIYALGFFNQVAGSAGDFEIDIIRHPANGDPPTSIFTTRPKIPSSAGNDARIVQQFLPTVQTLFSSPGVTVPVLALTQLTAGDGLTANIIGKQTGGQSAGIALALRPR